MKNIKIDTDFLLHDDYARTIYRIETPGSKHGMWYNEHGIFQKSIDILCPNGIAKDFPMPLNLELHRKDGEIWNSGMRSIEQSRHWFTTDDVKNLMNKGFKLFQFEVIMFQDLENETLFCRRGIIGQKEIPLEFVWDIHPDMNNP